jgi:hypothetical protein
MWQLFYTLISNYEIFIVIFMFGFFMAEVIKIKHAIFTYVYLQQKNYQSKNK